MCNHYNTILLPKEAQRVLQTSCMQGLPKSHPLLDWPKTQSIDKVGMVLSLIPAPASRGCDYNVSESVVVMLSAGKEAAGV